MDDFYGAMGEAQINVAASGMVTPQGMGKATIEINAQWSVPLGEVLVDESPAVVQGYKYVVQNKDFRGWRAKHQRGGDFMVLSDVRRVRLPYPQKISW